MRNKGMIKGLLDYSLDVKFCENFIYGKQSCTIFPSRATRVKEILELIHSDVFGPVPVPSLGDTSIISLSYMISPK